jgi:Major Facilitator Superfamily
MRSSSYSPSDARAASHRWRAQYGGGMKADEVKRLKELERENQSLKRIVAEVDRLHEEALLSTREVELLDPCEPRPHLLHALAECARRAEHRLLLEVAQHLVAVADVCDVMQRRPEERLEVILLAPRGERRDQLIETQVGEERRLRGRLYRSAALGLLEENAVEGFHPITTSIEAISHGGSFGELVSDLPRQRRGGRDRVGARVAPSPSPPVGPPCGSRRLEWPVLLALSVAGPLVYPTLASRAGYTNVPLLAALAAGVTAAAIFVSHERRARSPIVDLGLLGKTRLALGLGSALVSYLVLFAALFVVPYFLAAHRVSPALAGLQLAVLPCFIGIVAPIAGRLVDRLGERRLTVAGLALAAGGSIVIAVSQDSVGLLAGLATIGAGLGAFTPANNAGVMWWPESTWARLEWPQVVASGRRHEPALPCHGGPSQRIANTRDAGAGVGAVRASSRVRPRRAVDGQGLSAGQPAGRRAPTLPVKDHLR